ncbi:alpha/beta hydrolase [Sandaracinus amylolyticus]|uniref:alpha/beta hydrolase n=1 Tax=Sandaracinus amylolyticus TaxID=927083 RepID=UPI001EEF0FF8|nr:alpha/beta hydrolase-fold protein [Sandaracinus amylolyticus]UJR80920.1 Putative alpha-dextrin endo-1, 6-alpha-glucosidase [Sandaracinus amylolyticus]
MTVLWVGALVVGCGGEDPSAPNDAAVIDARVIEQVDAQTPSDAGVDAGDAIDASTESRLDALVELLSSEADVVLVDAALHEVALGEGWPLREGSRWLFATRWDGSPARVSLVSDVNAWSTSAHVATRAASGAHWFVVVDEHDFVASAIGAKYKWWGEPDIYRAPPESLAYGYDEYGEHGWVRPPSDAPHLERFVAFESAFLDAPRAVRAWLPAGFVARSEGASRVRTLLLHDGNNVFDPGAFFGGWQADATLAREGWSDVVAIAIDNAPDRMSAYTHVTDVIGGDTTGGRAADYLRMIEDEVLPFVRARYGIVARGRSLMIAGSSLGGLVSIWIASQRPELAGCVAGLSSTLGWGSIGRADGEDTLIARWSGHPAVAIYLDSGGDAGSGCVDSDGDGIDDDGDGRDNYCETLQMRDVLRAAGYVDGVDLHYLHAPGAAHDEAAWRARFPAVLDACDASGWAAP